MTIIGSVVASVLGPTLSAPIAAMVVRAYERTRDYRVGGSEPSQADESAAGPPAGQRI